MALARLHPFLEVALLKLSDTDRSVLKSIDGLKPRILEDGGVLTNKPRILNNDLASTYIYALSESESRKHQGLARSWRSIVGVKVWNDATGKYSVKARYVNHKPDSVTLKKRDGKRITVPIEKLGQTERKRLDSIIKLKPKVITAIEEMRAAKEQKRKDAEAAALARRARFAGKIIKLEDARAKRHNDEVKTKFSRWLFGTTALEQMKYSRGMTVVLKLRVAVDSGDNNEIKNILTAARSTSRAIEELMLLSPIGHMLLKVDDGEYVTMEDFWESCFKDVFTSKKDP